MPTVLVIGFDPYTVPGYDPDAIAAAIEQGSRLAAELGLAEELLLVDFTELDGRAQAKIAERLRQKQYDCVVVGGGIRKAPELLEVFQQVVNLVHWHQPNAAIAFNSGPGESADWVLKALEQRRQNNQ